MELVTVGASLVVCAPFKFLSSEYTVVANRSMFHFECGRCTVLLGWCDVSVEGHLALALINVLVPKISSPAPIWPVTYLP